MDLVEFIYCERQESGSMLCAQHALNNLMQSPIWTSENLADIARKLDLIEDSHLDQNDVYSTARRRGRASLNYDDSGFFSVQVIDDALNQLGLRIVRWRSEEMTPLHDYPENQEAFILNHDSHWFTLRRFGKNSDRWYNLNSMLPDSPKWIGPNFLSMTISQAEAEGYSIFTVLPTLPSEDPSAPQPGSLIDCEADERAYSMMMFSSGSVSPDVESNSLGSSSSTLNRRPRDKDDEGDVESQRRRIKRVEDQRSPVDEMSYEEQLKMAIEASLETGSSRSLNHLTEPQNDRDHQPRKGNNNHQSDSNTGDVGLKPVEIEEDDDPDLAAAISASLLKTDSDLTNNSSSMKGSEKDLDEPSPEELRQRRLARFS
ncbi:Josephin-domain-containing protein [Phakopsora pachyrhizi]|nr:Josephin-domain-containing protein [Phakopsora pachyrhizi]